MIMKFMKQDHGIKNSIDNEKKIRKAFASKFINLFPIFIGCFSVDWIFYTLPLHDGSNKKSSMWGKL